MEEILKKALDKDEKLLWSAKPEKFETLDKTYKPIFIRKTVISLVIAVALTVAYLIFASKMEAGVMWAIPVIIWALSVLSPLNIYRDAKRLSEKTLYAVTDRRFLIVNTENAKSVEFSRIDKVSFCTDKDGHTNLISGKDASDAPTANQREAAVIGASLDADGDKCERFVMYAIPNAAKLKKLLGDYVTVS